VITIASAMKGTPSNGVSFGAIMYLIYHIFLPPKLPQEDDFDSEYEMILLDTTIDVLLKFKDCVTDDQNGVIDSVVAMVTNLRAVRDSDAVGAVSQGNLGNVLRDLCKKGNRMSQNPCDLFHSI
jgi:hypothetical protein